jgi:hypothetical protein
MPPIPPKCQALKDELDALMQERADLQLDLQSAAGSGKASIVAGIRRLAAQINQKRLAFDECLGIQPLPAPLVAFLSGFLSFFAPMANPTTGVVPVTLVLTFDGPDRSQVDLQFPMIVFPGTLHLPLGVGTCAGSLNLNASEGFGAFDQTFGNMSVPLTLTASFIISGTYDPFSVCGGLKNLGLPYPSTMNLTAPGLTTGTVRSSASPTGSVSGVPLNRTTGSLTLVGSGTFSGGAAIGAADLIIAGTLSPIP